MAAETGPQIRVEVKDTRLDGVTFADALKQNAAFRDWSQIPVGAPNLFYESVKILQLAEDRKHALAAGRDESRIFLIRDGEPIYSIHDTGFTVLAGNDDLTKMIIESFYCADNGKIKSGGLIYIDTEAGRVTDLAFGESVDLLKRQDYEKFLVGEVHDGKTRIRLCTSAGRSTVLASVNRKFSFVALEEASADFEQVVWRGVKDGKAYIFRNNQVIARGEHLKTDVLASADLRRLAVLKKDRDKSRIILDGKEIFKSGDRIYETAATPDLCVFAVALEDRKGSNRHLIVYAEGTGISQYRFDSRLRFTTTDNNLTAEFLRGKAWRRLEFEVIRKGSGKAGEIRVSETSGEGAAPAQQASQAPI